MEKNTNSEPQNEEVGLSREEANKQAFEAHGADFGNVAHEPKEETATVEATESLSSVSTEETKEALEPPVQWRKERKEAWAKLPREDQEEILRVTNGPESRLAELRREAEQFKNEKAKYEPYEKLISEAQRFAKARGEDIPSPQQVVASMQLANDLRGQKLSTIIDVLETQGLPVPEKLREAAESEGDENGLSEKRLKDLVEGSIQKYVNPLIEREVARESAQYRETMRGHWESFLSSKNDTGGLKYLDVQTDDPRSLQLQSQMAHLVAGHTDFSKQFIATEQARNPNITMPELIARAYEFYGGKVDHSSRSPSEKANLQRAHRAAASSPGRGTSGRNNDSAPKGLSREEANAYAYRKVMEERG